MALVKNGRCRFLSWLQPMKKKVRILSWQFIKSDSTEEERKSSVKRVTDYPHADSFVIHVFREVVHCDYDAYNSCIFIYLTFP